MIRVENLGKKYVIGHQREGGAKYKALRDVIADGVRSLNPFGAKQGEDPAFDGAEWGDWGNSGVEGVSAVAAVNG